MRNSTATSTILNHVKKALRKSPIFPPAAIGGFMIMKGVIGETVEFPADNDKVTYSASNANTAGRVRFSSCHFNVLDQYICSVQPSYESALAE